MDLNKLLLSIIFLFTPIIANATNGYFAHGTGVKNKAMAGAGVAYPQDALAAAINPAGMAFVGNRFDIGATVFSPDREYSSRPSLANGSGGAFTVGPNSIESDDKHFLIPSFGINYNINEHNAVGFSIYGNGGLNTSYSGGTASFDPTGMGGAGVTFPGTFGAGTAGVDLFQIFFNASYAYRFNEHLSIGVSPLFAVQGFRSNGLETFAPFTKTFAQSGGMVMPSNLSQNGQDYTTGWGAQFGVMAQDVIGTADFAFSYRTKMSMDEFDDYSDLFAEEGDFDIPSTYWAGFSVDVTENITLVADYQRIEYDDSDAVSNPIQNLFNCPTLGGTDFESCLGGENGAGFGWENIDVYKVGLDWRVSEGTTVRFGYSHTDQPIDNSQVLFNILAPGVIEDHVTAGATFETAMGEVNVMFMHALHNSVTGPNPFDPTQTIRLKMHQTEVGVSWSSKF